MPHLELAHGCLLRPIEERDAGELQALIEANRPELARWLAWAEHQTLAETQEFIARAHRQRAANDGFQAALVEDGRLIGMVGFHAIDWANRATSLGYWLERSAQGRGTMTEAVRAMVDYAFGALRLHRVEIRLDVENERSRALAERLGFTREGVLREAMRVAGAYHDDAVYSMLAAEWPEHARRAAESAGERVR